MQLQIWQPNPIDVQKTHVFQSMKKWGFELYEDFWEWSVYKREEFWSYVIKELDIPFKKRPDQILDISDGVTNPHWLKGARFNIADACFNADPTHRAILYQPENGVIETWTYGELDQYVNKIANSFSKFHLKKGDIIAIDMLMNVEAVAVYLAAVKAGLTVATIADSFTPEEIKVRLEITQPKLIFTQDYILRGGKKLPLYSKVSQVSTIQHVVMMAENSDTVLKRGDSTWHEFLSDNNVFESVDCNPEDITTVLFSSGTTSVPKAIPWTHTTPIKCASDGYFHQDIHPQDVVAWPTNLGWMMGPWLIFATLINKGTIALYGGSPLGKDFGQFVQNAQVTILGIVPSIVKQWKITGYMEKMDWSAIKCFSSTGEASNPEEYSYLMQLAGNKPIIEYCGGTEIGGGYLCSTLIQNNIPSVFSTKALGSDFILLDEKNCESAMGEVFIIPPSIGLSNTLLNKDHFEVYYQDTPIVDGKILRRHGDQIEALENGYFKAQGRVDDAMNLGGIKVSSIQIETVVNSLEFVKESAAVSVSPQGGGPENLIVYWVSLEHKNPEDTFAEIAHIVKTKINPLFKVYDVVMVNQLPRTASGKIMRRELRAAYMQR